VGAVGVDLLINVSSSISRRFGGADLYASLAAVNQGAKVDFLTILGPEINEYALNIWRSMGISFDLAKYLPSYNLSKYLVKVY